MSSDPRRPTSAGSDARPDEVVAPVEVVRRFEWRPIAHVALVEGGEVADAIAIELDPDPRTCRNLELAAVPHHRAAADHVVLEVPVVGLVVEDEVPVSRV